MKEKKESNSNDGFLKKIMNFFKNHKALASLLGAILTWLLYLVGVLIIILLLVYPIISFFSTFSGKSEEELVKEERSLEETTEAIETGETSCYKGWTGFWGKIGDWISPGISSNCEFADTINKAIKSTEEEYAAYDLDLSPGLVVSTIINTYGSGDAKTTDDSGNTRDVAGAVPTEVLNDIIKQGLLDAYDIKEIIDAMTMHKSFWYYTCSMTSSVLYDSDCNRAEEYIDDMELVTEETELLRGKKCTMSFYDDVYYDEEKFKLYLRYGKDVANLYQFVVSHNESKIYTCPECYEHITGNTFDPETIDDSIFMKSADIDSDTEDDVTINIDGSIFKKLDSTFSENLFTLFTGNVRTFLDNIFISLKSIIREDITSKSYDYYNGFVYNNYKVLQSYEKDIYLPKTIEKRIETILSYSTIENQIYGTNEEDIGTGSKGLGKVNQDIKHEEVFCSKKQSCDCPNGNITPGITFTGRYISNGVCNILASAEDAANVRLVACSDKYYGRLPGGYEMRNGKAFAKNLITWSEYIKGVATAEIGAGSPLESVKFQMLIGQTYALNRFTEGSSKFYQDGDEIVVTIGTCAQSYKNPEVAGNLDTAYPDIKEKLLVDSDGTITYSAYRSSLQNEAKSQAKSGKKFTEILDSPYVRSYKKGGSDYSTAQVMECGNLFTNSPEYTASLINNAYQFVGYTRESFMAATDVNTTGSWCARFVSHIIKNTPGSPITYTTSSVSNFLNYFVNSGRFCHSKYWADRYGTYVCNNSPQPGDIVIFAYAACNYQGNGHLAAKTSTCIRHVGIVTKVSDTQITYVHGNTSRCRKGVNGVCESTEDIGDSYIIGYGR